VENGDIEPEQALEETEKAYIAETSVDGGRKGVKKELERTYNDIQEMADGEYDEGVWQDLEGS